MFLIEPVEGWHRAQTALGSLNLVSITIFREDHLLDVNSVSNGAKLRGWFWFQVGTEPGRLQQFSM